MYSDHPAQTVAFASVHRLLYLNAPPTSRIRAWVLSDQPDQHGQIAWLPYLLRNGDEDRRLARTDDAGTSVIVTAVHVEAQSASTEPRTVPIHILLADDHDILRAGLRALLDTAADMVVAGEVSTGLEAVSETIRLSPTVVLMDISLPGLDGIEACRQIRQQVPQTRVLILTMHETPSYLLLAIRAGASGYLIKRTAATELLSAIRAVARGETCFPVLVTAPGFAGAATRPPVVGGAPVAAESIRTDEVTSQSEGQAENHAVEDPQHPLSARELEVLPLVAEGLTSQEIASRLQLSVKTVQAHRAAIMEKLNLRNVADLVRYAIRRGLIDLTS